MNYGSKWIQIIEGQLYNSKWHCDPTEYTNTKANCWIFSSRHMVLKKPAGMDLGGTKVHNKLLWILYGRYKGQSLGGDWRNTGGIWKFNVR